MAATERGRAYASQEAGHHGPSDTSWRRPTIVRIQGRRATILPLGQLSWADKVVGFAEVWPRQSLPGNNPRVAISAPDYQRNGDGKDVVLGHGGGLIVAFTDNALMDVPGPDLVIVETGDKIEPTRGRLKWACPDKPGQTEFHRSFSSAC